jgi:hypothetical protein
MREDESEIENMQHHADEKKKWIVDMTEELVNE